MRGVIFGSGIVGLVAKHILAGDWTIVPFRRSRYFSFNPALDDNFIIRDKDLDDLASDLGGKLSPIFYRRAYSLGGELISEHSDGVRDAWLRKIFGADVPPQALPYWEKRLITPIYGIRVNQLYQTLVNEHLPVLKAEALKGDVTEIGDHYFVRGGVREEFDNAVSTIPLPSLLRLMGIDGKALKASLTVHYYHIHSTRIDLEGANQALVADDLIDFYKVTNVSPQRYLFYSVREIKNPGAYFLNVIGPGDVLDGTRVQDAMPTGQMPDLSDLEGRGTFCVGSAAQADWCADVGSNLLRLVRYAQRGYKPA